MIISTHHLHTPIYKSPTTTLEIRMVFFFKLNGLDFSQNNT